MAKVARSISNSNFISIDRVWVNIAVTFASRNPFRSENWIRKLVGESLNNFSFHLSYAELDLFKQKLRGANRSAFHVLASFATRVLRNTDLYRRDSRPLDVSQRRATFLSYVSFTKKEKTRFHYHSFDTSLRHDDIYSHSITRHIVF